MTRHRAFSSPWTLAAMAAAVLFLPTSARADFDWDVRAGIYTEDTDPFIGGGGLWDLGSKGAWYFNPNLEIVFVENGDLFTVNGDVHYDLEVDTPFYVWLGGGPALIRSDPDRGDSETDFGANLIAGIGMKRSGLRPYGQLKVLLADDSQAVVAVGVRF